MRIMYIHVPAAWLALGIYTLMAIAALGTLVWRHPLADVAAKAAAPIGAAFSLICLLTGALWGRPTWGTYWVWDARLTSVLVLFLVYLGILALWRAIDDPGRAARAVAILDPGRLHQRADRQVLGRLVEHPAPAGLRVPSRRLTIHPVSLAPLLLYRPPDSRLFLALHARRHAQRDPAPSRAHAAMLAAAGAGEAERWTSGPTPASSCRLWGGGDRPRPLWYSGFVLDHRGSGGRSPSSRRGHHPTLGERSGRPMNADISAPKRRLVVLTPWLVFAALPRCSFSASAPAIRRGCPRR